MNNMDIYEKSTAPENALKKIQAGRLKGKSDINPMWRIKKLTELFGPVGVGWHYTIEKQWLEQCNNGEVAAFCNIALYVKIEGEWSKPIYGIGGSMFVANEKNGAYVSDECFKMALTDAISVACKALGFAANVYWEADRTKYSPKPEQPVVQNELICKSCGMEIRAVKKPDNSIVSPEDVAKGCGGLCYSCYSNENSKRSAQ